ncbi:DUF2637 domain-containing protein [Actinomadura sp. LD22]|uniref:DUF2637 domain-containing protein n=1 Tax=Actinomadura physcomitrii TaxID=2650748 RepID=A0A6I4MDT0_9ACTN|nr:DUF2637 domain-containing protein [Actinomadura physcomitrii]MWA02167.1 DUF2637 domain-containing protein [Actinomadura physcomitrii]
MTRPTFFAHRATIVLMAVVVLVATGDGFAQSYAGLYHWATEHHLKSWKADTFPLLVDLFVAVGELGMFALALEGHRLRKSVMSWADVALPFGIAAAGWGVSLVFNVGSVGHRFSDQATAAVPPVASMLGLLVLLRTLHRLVTRPADGLDASVSVRASVADADRADGAANGYSIWAALEDAPPAEVEPVATPDPLDDWYDETDPEPETGGRDQDETDPEPGAADETDGSEPDETDPVLEPVIATARDRFADVIATGGLPSVRAVRREMRVGYPRAVKIRAALDAVAGK